MRKAAIAAIALVLCTVYAFAQTPNPLVGSWERIKSDPPNPPAFLIFSTDGFFSQSILPTGRPKLNAPLRELTVEQLAVRYEDLVARYGPYKIEGNKLIRRDVGHHNPNIQGRLNTELFRIEGDTLIISNLQGKDTGWFKRAEPQQP